MADEAPAPSSSSVPGAGRETALAFLLGLLVLLAVHARHLSMPYHWDELFFAPWAHDVHEGGGLLPRHGPIYGHAPLVPLFVGGVFTVFGASIPAARLAMVLLTAGTVAAVYALGRRLGGRFAGWTAVALTLSSPLFLAHSIFVLLDQPTALLAVLSMNAFFAGRDVACGLLCTALVLTKQTGAVVPAVLALLRLRRPARFAVIAVPPLLAVLGWFAFLRSRTGHWFGDPEWTSYNVTGTLSLTRIGEALTARSVQTFLAQGQVGVTLAILYALVRSKSARALPWVPLAGVVLGFVVAHGLLGGALLARYLLPAIAILYVGAGAALSRIPRREALVVGGICVVLLASVSIGGSWHPTPHEDTLDGPDFVAALDDAADWLAAQDPPRTVTTVWPLTDAVTNPIGGYVEKRLPIRKIDDFTPETLRAVASEGFDLFAAFPRWIGHRPDEDVVRILPVRRVVRFEHGRNWVEIWERER